MPYASEKQRRWMYANHPDIAARWDAQGHNYVVGKKGPKAGHRAMHRVHQLAIQLRNGPK